MAPPCHWSDGRLERWTVLVFRTSANESDGLSFCCHVVVRQNLTFVLEKFFFAREYSLCAAICQNPYLSTYICRRHIVRFAAVMLHFENVLFLNCIISLLVDFSLSWHVETFFSTARTSSTIVYEVFKLAILRWIPSHPGKILFAIYV